MSKALCHIETFDQDGNLSEESATVDDVTIGSLIDRERDTWSTTLRIYGDGQELALSLSSGHAALLLTTGPDDFYDRVGEASLRGSVEFVHGGQAADHPRRHVLSVETATTVAREFLLGGRITPLSSEWEKQESFQSE